jgi:hypothetical protein
MYACAAAAARVADGDRAAAVPEAREALLQHVAADRVDDHVAPAPLGDPHHLAHEVPLPVVDAVVHAERAQPLELRVGRRRREHPRPCALRQLDRGGANAAPAALDQHRFAGLQAPELEEAVVGGAERDRHARGLLDREAVGHDPRRAHGHRAQRGVRAERAHRDHALPDAPVGDLGADLADHAGALVADDVRTRGQFAAGAAEHVAALDADRLHLDQHALGVALRVGHVLVAEDARAPGLVVDGGLHLGPPRPPG